MGSLLTRKQTPSLITLFLPLLVYFFFFLHKSPQSVCSFRYILSMTLSTLNPQRPPSQSSFLSVVALFAFKRTEILLQFRSWPRLDRNTWHEAAGAIPHMYVPPASLRRGLHRTPGSLGGATAALCSHGPWPSLQSGQAHSLLMHWFTVIDALVYLHHDVQTEQPE